MKNDGEDLSRKAGCRGDNLKGDSEFQSGMEEKIKENPTKSINPLANKLSVNQGRFGISLICEHRKPPSDRGHEEVKRQQNVALPRQI
uniref:Uncharacterized protein n=1 Tax=Lepeophtheirus salmonis TaxID=72036 RepID=A0A0K2T5M1_LEPSM